MPDFNLTITAAKTNGGYQYQVSDTSATGVESGWWYYVVLEFPNGKKVSNDQKDGAEGDPIDGEITIDSKSCGQKISNQREAYRQVKAILYRCKKADKYDTGKDNFVMEKTIDVKVID